VGVHTISDIGLNSQLRLYAYLTVTTHVRCPINYRSKTGSHPEMVGDTSRVTLDEN